VLTADHVDLVILDLQLDPESGLAILRSLRASSDLPIIVLTGQHRDDVDHIDGLELGGHDYITEPFSPRQLVARSRARIRRSERRSRRSQEQDQDRKRVRYRFAGWELSRRHRRLTSPAGETVSLTRGEFALLVAFVQAPQRVLTREHLLASSRVHG